jgi:hypothetical protein
MRRIFTVRSRKAMAMASAGMDTAAKRDKYAADYAKLVATLPTAGASALGDGFLRLESRLDSGMVEAKSALLMSGLLTTDEDDALGAWIYQQHASLARTGHAIARKALAEGHEQMSEAMWVVALALLHWGEAVKWELMVGRREQRDYATLHELARMAHDHGQLASSGTLVVDGLERFASVEALYFRTLLLDRFTSGSLTRQQIEVLDAWLWEWAPALASTANPQAPVMRADLDSDHGLRYGPRQGEGTTLYLSLAALEACRRDVIAEFHAGRIVPARGRAAEIRIEAHVAVLLQLRRTFSGDEARAPREPGRGRAFEAWFGLSEIAAAIEIDAAERAGMRADAPGKARRAGDKYDEVYEKRRRSLALVDVSASGWLFESTVQPSQGLLIGELVALRPEAGAPFELARVVRRVREAGSERVQIGMQRLSDAAVRLRTCKLRSEAGDEETYIFAPGADASGRHDAFVVPYRLLESKARFRVACGGREYAFELNRVRRRGRGWALAGFEMVDARLEYLIA